VHLFWGDTYERIPRANMAEIPRHGPPAHGEGEKENDIGLRHAPSGRLAGPDREGSVGSSRHELVSHATEAQKGPS